MFGKKQDKRPGGFGVGLTDPRFFEDHFKPFGGSNLLKYFFEPGSDIEKLLMRTKIKDERQLNAIILAMDRYTEFNQHRHMKMLMRKLAGAVSIDGLGRIEGLMAGTGVVSPSLFEVVLSPNYKHSTPEIIHQRGNGADAYEEAGEE